MVRPRPRRRTAVDVISRRVPPAGGPDLDAFLATRAEAAFDERGGAGAERPLSRRRLRRLRVGEADPPAPGGVRAHRRLAPRRGPPADGVRQAVRRVAAAARPNAAEAYARRILVRANVDESRRPWRRERTSLDGHDEAAPAGPSYEERSALRRRPPQLPPMQRKVVVLRHMARPVGVRDRRRARHLRGHGQEPHVAGHGRAARECWPRGIDNGSMAALRSLLTMNTLQADLDAAIPDAPLLPEVDDALRAGRSALRRRRRGTAAGVVAAAAAVVFATMTFTGAGPHTHGRTVLPTRRPIGW